MKKFLFITLLSASLLFGQGISVTSGPVVMGDGDERYAFGRFSPDGRWLANTVACPDPHLNGAIHLWDTESFNLKATLIGHAIMAMGVAFSPDGRTLAVAAWSKTRLWDMTANRFVRELSTSFRDWRATPLAFGPDGKTLALQASKTKELWLVVPK